MRKTKAPPITPVFDKNRNRWRLSIPKKYSPSGKRERKFFKTKGLAEIEAVRLKALLTQWGLQSRKIPADLAQDALRAHELLKAKGFSESLSAVSKSFIARTEERNASVTFDVARATYTKKRKELSQGYLRASERILDKIASEIGSVNLRGLNGEYVERALDKHFHTPQSFDLSLRTLSPLFTMALKRSPAWMDKNPCSAISKRTRGRKAPVTVLSIDSVIKVLEIEPNSFK